MASITELARQVFGEELPESFVKMLATITDTAAAAAERIAKTLGRQARSLTERHAGALFGGRPTGDSDDAHRRHIGGYAVQAILGTGWAAEQGIGTAGVASAKLWDLSYNELIQLAGARTGDKMWNREDIRKLGIPEAARGGIVRRPTLAMIGEAGPEAIIPLGGPHAPDLQPAVINNYHYHIDIDATGGDPDRIADVLLPAIRELERRGSITVGVTT